MSEIVTAAGIIFDYALDGITSTATAVTGTPILLASAVMGLAFVGVGLFKRLLSTNI